MPHPGPLQKLIDMCSTSHVHIDTSIFIHENGGIVFVYPPIQDKEEEEEDAGRDRISTTCPPLSISTTTEATLKQQDVRAMRDNSTLLSPKMMAFTATTTTTNDEVLDEWVIV